jgi:outer membrane lipoprotein-sorting protein
MSKIQTIKISNFKSITDLEANFNGCTAIVTGGNNKGKTSFLKGVVDRIRFIRPEVMVKKGEQEGRGELVLDSGEKFVWEFDNSGKDKLTYITDQGRQSVTKDLGKQFFPPVFDIDKFLQSSPSQQVKQLQAIVGLDFTEIDERYRVAYNARTERNREAEIYHVKLEKMMKVERVESVDLTELKAKKEAEKTRLNTIYLDNKASNQKLRDGYNKERESIQKKTDSLNECMGALSVLQKHGYTGDALQFVSDLRKAIPELKEPVYIEEMPERTELDKIDAALLTASQTNADALKYKEYVDYKSETEAAKNAAKDADELVKSIEDERQKMIESVSFPEGISINSEGILVDGLPLDKNQISTSKLYCSALRIASMNLGEVKTLYFDASFLDKVTLAEIQTWANGNDLQLLIERPDFDGGEIQYQLIES